MGKAERLTIRETKDYSIFETHEVNRQLHRFARPTEYARIKSSMECDGFLPSCAIHVCGQVGSNKLLIVDGHNRFDIAKELGLGIVYIRDDSVRDPHDLGRRGTGTVWSVRDWIDGYANAGNAHYLKLIQFRETHGLGQMAAIALVAGLSASSGTGDVIAKVKAGTFVVGDMTHARSVVRVTDAARLLGIEFATRHSFVVAISALYRVPGFDGDWLIHKMQKLPANLRCRTSVSDWLDEIQTLYNFDTKGPRRIPTLAGKAREAMRERKENFAGKRPAKGSKMPRREK